MATRQQAAALDPLVNEAFMQYQEELAVLRAKNERYARALLEISLVDLSGDGGRDLCMCATFQAVAKEALRDCGQHRHE